MGVDEVESKRLHKDAKERRKHKDALEKAARSKLIDNTPMSTVIIGFGAFFAVCAGAILLAIKCSQPISTSDSDSSEPPQMSYSQSSGQTYVPPSKPRTQMPQVKLDPEMSRKYMEIARKKRQLSMENKELLGKYANGGCFNRPQGKPMNMYCKRISRRVQKNNQWLERH